jgi:4-hydroxysphinganine ceramide fatty acyl 2-hydroxylase
MSRFLEVAREMRSVYKECMPDRRVLFLAAMWLVYGISAGVTGFHDWTWIYIVCGIMMFYVFEYILHRWLLHGIGKWLMPKAYHEHHYHHDEPEKIDFLLTPNSYNIPYHALLWVGFSLILGFSYADALVGFHYASALLFTFCLSQMYYEWIHFVSHRPITPRTNWGKHMKKHHLLHHFKSPEAWYGVTNDHIDRVMGTGGKADAHKRSISK